LAQNPQPLGFIPFASSHLAPEPEEPNKHLIQALHNSGSFHLIMLDTLPGFYTLQQMHSLADTTIPWILTGSFELESQKQTKGKIPLLIYKPQTVFTIQLVYRLYNTKEKKWEDIGKIKTEKRKGGNYQFLEYDKDDPSLILSAKERQELRIAAYQDISQKLIKRLESKIKIKK